jgi:hypothetical protein
MTPQSQARLVIAESVSAFYASHPDVRTVFAFGSVGHGFADDWSDLELGVIWSRTPDSATLRNIAAQAGGANWSYLGFHEKKLSHGDAFTVHDLGVEPAHWTDDVIDRIIDAVIRDYDVSQNMLMYERQATVATLLRCVPFSGQNYLQALRTRVADYPRPLALAMIRKNLSLGPIDLLTMLAGRGEIPLFSDHLAGRIRTIHSLLFALNSIYHPGFKWTRFFLREAKILPPNFEARIDGLFASDLPAAVPHYREIAVEMFELVAKHFPEIDLTDARRQFHEPRPRWGQAGP